MAHRRNYGWYTIHLNLGIHERKGRDKIQESNIGHVLNDETQRKWIQAIKRLMTFAQKKWPPDSISKLMG
jgi:pre-mRNA-splicing factor 18